MRFSLFNQIFSGLPRLQTQKLVASSPKFSDRSSSDGWHARGVVPTPSRLNFPNKLFLLCCGLFKRVRIH